MNAEIQPIELKRERAKMYARCRALTLEQRKVIEGLIQEQAGTDATTSPRSRGEAIRKCASLQTEFLRAAAGLRLLGERLLQRDLLFRAEV